MNASIPNMKILIGLTAVLAAALIGMVIMLKVKGLSDDTSLAGIFAFLAVISSIFLYAFLRHIKSCNRD